MDAQSVEALATTFTLLSGFAEGTRRAIRKDKAAKLAKLEQARADEIEAVEKPWREKVTELQAKITQLQQSTQQVIEMAVQTHQDRIDGLIADRQAAIDNAIQGCQAELGRMEQDRNYWRGVAMGRAVSLTKQDNLDRQQADTDHDNRTDTP